MSGYDVDTDSLVSTGDTFVEIADEAQAAKADFVGRVAVHDGANDGFTATGSARSLADQWEFQIDDLCKRTAMAGGLLADSADGYRQVEDAVIESLPPLSSGD